MKRGKTKVVFSCNDYGSEKLLSGFCSLEERDFDLMTSGQIKYRLDWGRFFYKSGVVFIYCKALTKYTALLYM